MLGQLRQLVHLLEHLPQGELAPREPEALVLVRRHLFTLTQLAQPLPDGLRRGAVVAR